MAKLLKRLLGMIFPITCAACGADLPPDDQFRICNACSGKIEIIDGLFCRKCGIPLPDGGAHCYRCRKNARTHYAAIRSAGVYDGTLRELLHKFKYMNRDYLALFFGALLADAVALSPCLADAECVVAVPMHWTRRFLRGYNQAELLAAMVARHTGRPLVQGMLRRTRTTAAQYRLSRQERFENLKNTFSVRGSFKKRTVLLIDDICTTGATIDACAAALRRAGAKTVYGLTVARDCPRGNRLITPSE